MATNLKGLKIIHVKIAHGSNAGQTCIRVKSSLCSQLSFCFMAVSLSLSEPQAPA